MRSDPRELVDLERYPVDQPDSPRGRAVIAQARRTLADRGCASLPGFLRPTGVATLVAEVEKLRPLAFHEDTAAGTAYLELPDPSFPEGHPRRTPVHSATWVIAYDLVPDDAVARALYEWDALMEFVGEILERRPLHRYADPLGALNLTAMTEGDVQGWHYDATDFVVSLALQASRGGGLFECASRIRSAEDENYAEVAQVLAGRAPGRVEVFPMVPGTLMVFQGRHSLHRVSPVEGDVPRYVALLAYDTKPGTDSSPLLKRVRYGRSEPVRR
jgi:hypothetical protein